MIGKRRLYVPAGAGILIAALTLFCLTIESHGQERPIRAEFRVSLHTIVIGYGDPNVKGQGAILQGEPLLLQIQINNLRTNGPATTAVELDWLAHLTFTLRAGGRFDPATMPGVPIACIPLPGSQREWRVRRTTNALMLDRDGVSAQTCRLDVAADSLMPGRNVITVDWSATRDKARFREIMPHEPQVTEFEFREVRTPADELDLWNHLAVRALDNGRLDVARELVGRVLAREPLSTTALIVRGRLHAAEGRCHAAAADWELAATVIENQSDIQNQRLPPIMDEDRRMAAAAWRERARRLNCR